MKENHWSMSQEVGIAECLLDCISEVVFYSAKEDTMVVYFVKKEHHKLMEKKWPHSLGPLPLLCMNMRAHVKCTRGDGSLRNSNPAEYIVTYEFTRLNQANWYCSFSNAYPQDMKIRPFCPLRLLTKVKLCASSPKHTCKNYRKGCLLSAWIPW